MWVAAVGLAAAVLTWLAYQMIAPAILHYSTFDYWFEGDTPAIVRQLSDRLAQEHERSNRHPLFALLVYPMVSVLRNIAGLDRVQALGMTYAGLAAVFTGFCFLLLRRVGLRRIDALTFTALVAASASAVFWLPVPETRTPAALSLVIALFAVIRYENTGRLSWLACVLVCAATVGMTLTNAVAGFLVCLVVLGWKRAAPAIAVSVALVAAGQFVQRQVFPHAASFVTPGTEMSVYLLNPLAGDPLDRLAGFFLHSIIAPPVQQGYTAYLSFQQAAFSSTSVATLLGWVVWLVLLAVGVVGLLRSRRKKLATVLLLFLASQLALMLVFGLETFVYALLTGPLLVLVAAFGCLTSHRRWVLGGAATLLALAALENGRRFVDAAALVRGRYDGAQEFVTALNARTGPDDLVVLGLQPAAALGWVAHRSRDPRPLTRLPRFDSLRVARKGWEIYHEHWSPETLEEMRRGGARYFASEYGYGVRTDTAVRRYLASNATLVEGDTAWVIYALRPPSDTTARAP